MLMLDPSYFQLFLALGIAIAWRAVVVMTVNMFLT
jgi:hypothetical protein